MSDEEMTKAFDAEEGESGGWGGDYEALQKHWNEGKQSVQRGSNGLISQQDLPLDPDGTAFRMVEPRFYDAWVHMVQDKKGNWHRLVCFGDKNILGDRENKEHLDPENCPICRYVLEHKMVRGYPKHRFYFRVINRRYQDEQRSQNLKWGIQILECGPQLFDQITGIIMHPSYMENVIDPETKKPVVDPTTRKPKKKISPCRFDIIVIREKTGPQDKDVEYSAIAGGPDSFIEFDDEEIAAINRMQNEGKPNAKALTTLPDDEKLAAAIGGAKESSDSVQESSMKRRSNTRDDDRVGFGG